MADQAKLTWQEFENVELRSGTIIDAQPFPEARRPAYKLWIDFGELGIKKSSAQITEHYQLDELIGKQILAVVNFPPKQIGPFMSECLVTGLIQSDGSVILAVPDKAVDNGLRLA
ncbi:MAG: tRNA-binding protein [Calditrichia bacterium]